MKQSCEYLSDLVYDHTTADKIPNVFDETKKYSAPFKQCFYELLQLNVSASKVSDVIKGVLRMADIEPNKLSSKGTILGNSLLVPFGRC